MYRCTTKDLTLMPSVLKHNCKESKYSWVTNLGVAAVVFWVMWVRVELWAVLYWKQVVYQVASWEFRLQTWDHPQTFWSHWLSGKLEDCNTTTSTCNLSTTKEYNTIPNTHILMAKIQSYAGQLSRSKSFKTLKNTANKNAEKLTPNYASPAFS